MVDRQNGQTNRSIHAAIDVDLVYNGTELVSAVIGSASVRLLSKFHRSLK